MIYQRIEGLNRKDQHVALADLQYNDASAADFAQTRFVHHSLPEMAIEDVSIKTQVAGLEFDRPFFINAMTGGSEKQVKSINCWELLDMSVKSQLLLGQ